MSRLAGVAALLFAVSCLEAVSAADGDIRAEAQALQRWANYYNKSISLRLFSGVVAISSNNSDFKFVTDASIWGSLSEAEQNPIFTNAFNAVQVAYCAQSDHKGELIPGLSIRLVDKNGNDLKGKVTGPGIECR